MKKFKKVLKNQKGQGMLEYILILAVVLIIGVMFKKQIMGLVDGQLTNINNKTSEFNQ